MRWRFWCRCLILCADRCLLLAVLKLHLVQKIRIISRRAIKGGNETVVREGRECSITITCVIETVASASRHERRQNV